ncbi:MAG: DUF6427 family protein [Flavobacterium sp.]
MITSIFKKSTIVNYSLIGTMLLVFFFLYQTSDAAMVSAPNGIARTATLFILLLTSFFLVNFTVKKNNLTKDSSYTVFFFFLFFLIFPSVFGSLSLMFANFFLILAMRRLISLQTLKSPKEKIFDASMWIFIASLFHFWCILFVLLVYISIFFHVSRDYRNWILPFVAFFVTGIIFMVSALAFDQSWITHIINQTRTNFELDYFTNNYQNIALSFFVVVALYFLLSMILSLTNKPLILQASYKKMIFGFLIGVTIFLISPEKNSTVLIFTFMPLSVLATTNIESSQNQMYQEITLLIAIVGCFLCFFTQL